MSMENIPVINIRALEDPETLQALDAACRNWGFFQVVDHGIDLAVTKRLNARMQEFFRMPKAAKRSISRTAANPWGFFDQELTKNTLDWKEVFDYGPAEPADNGQDTMIEPQWPDFVAEFKPAMLDYYRDCETLAFRLLSAISRNLGMPEAHLSQGFLPGHTSFVRLNYYPVCPIPASPRDATTPETGHLGVNHHTDAGALTLLLQDEQPGLEVFKDGAWHLVQPRSDALVVNIGDIVQVWSNDQYRASLHRVTANETNDRFSAPFFFNPAYRADYAPLPTMVDADHPARYQPINWGEFRSLRSSGDYVDDGEEVQISHYAARA
jgi:isopenicillin N synthase-like dioxygenase